MAISSLDSSILREWAPLTDLFNILPSRAQNGIFNQEVKLTCVDVLQDFIALGSNVGVVYWYNRKKKDLQRLRCENVNSPISVVKVISTVDYMLACGNKEGNISIFQIPKSHPDNLPENLKPKNKQVERYTVTDMHKGPVSAIEWSKNGMKLFSGDKNGLVVLTELDFYMHICKSVEILNEAYEVIQLSYYQQILLISTTYRSIICQRNDKWKVSQVGKKDRKVLGNFGGIFYQNGLGPNDIVLYCTRPGLRIWLADVTGSVQQTLLFKDILNKQCPEIPLINPISHNLKRLKPAKEASFGSLLTFQEDLLVTYGSDVLYVLNPKDLTVINTVSNLRGILSVATNKEEIFILEEDRSLIRLAYQPELLNDKNFSIPASTTFIPIPSSIRELTSKFHGGSILSAIPPFIETPQNEFNIHTDLTSVVSAEEALESPRRYPVKEKSASSEIKLDAAIDRTKRTEIYNKISEEDFDDTILFKHRRRRKASDMTTSANSLSSNSSDERDGSVSKATLMNMSTVSIMPDLRSPDSILTDIEQKEKILADVLNFDKIKFNLKRFNEFEGETKASESVPQKKASEVNKAIEISVRKSLDHGKRETKETEEQDVKSESYIYNTTNNQTKGNTTISKQEFFTCKAVVEDSATKNQFLENYFLDNTVANLEEDPSLYTNGLCSNFVSQSDAPAVINIPDDWNLSKVMLNVSNCPSEPDVSLADWELI